MSRSAPTFFTFILLASHLCFHNSRAFVPSSSKTRYRAIIPKGIKYRTYSVSSYRPLHLARSADTTKKAKKPSIFRRLFGRNKKEHKIEVVEISAEPETTRKEAYEHHDQSSKTSNTSDKKDSKGKSKDSSKLGNTYNEEDASKETKKSGKNEVHSSAIEEDIKSKLNQSTEGNLNATAGEFGSVFDNGIDLPMPVEEASDDAEEGKRQEDGKSGEHSKESNGSKNREETKFQSDKVNSEDTTVDEGQVPHKDLLKDEIVAFPGQTEEASDNKLNRSSAEKSTGSQPEASNDKSVAKQSSSNVSKKQKKGFGRRVVQFITLVFFIAFIAPFVSEELWEGQTQFVAKERVPSSSVDTELEVPETFSEALPEPKIEAEGSKENTMPPNSMPAEKRRQMVLSFVSDAVNKVGPSVLRIDTETHMLGEDDGMPSQPPGWVQQGQGSGLLFSSDGLILTNAHVVEDATKVTVTLTDGRMYKAEVKGADEIVDIAVIKIIPESRDGSSQLPNLPVAQLGDSDKLKVGQIVIAVGSPGKHDESFLFAVSPLILP